MKKLLGAIILLISFNVQAQYITQTGAGYQFKRTKSDSTILIPTFCGVPTLRGSTVTKQSAIAFDSCNNRLYYYNPKTLVWDSLRFITDTQYLRRDINTNTSQTIANASAIQQRIDSLRNNAGILEARKGGVFVPQFTLPVSSVWNIKERGADTTGIVNAAAIIQLGINLGYKSITGNTRKAIRNLLDNNLIEYTIPDKPTSKNQMYKLARR